MMNKLWAITYKDILATFTDRNVVLIMLVTPLLISTIVALAFGNFTGGGAPLQNVPVALVNLDSGDSSGFNAGNVFVSAFIPAEAADGDSAAPGGCEAATSNTGENSTFSLQDMTNATLLDDPAEARAGVDAGTYAAAIIIPADYSRRMAYTQDNPEIDPVPVEVYGDSARTLSPQIIRSITEGIANQLLTGQIAVAATVDALVNRAQENPGFGLTFLAANASGQFQPDFACAFTPAFNSVRIDQQAVGGTQTGFNPLVLIGSAQAVFFALFTANGGATSIMEERREGTLQRLVISPTPRIIILSGKALGVLAVVLVQLLILFAALSLISGLLYDDFAIWGSDWLSIALMLLFTALAASGVGMLTAAVAGSPEMANTIGGIVALFMGVLGGAFFSVEAIPVLQPFTRLSIVRWGSEGFTKLAQGNTDILVNLVFLALIGGALFGIGLLLFTRRQDI